jgi:protease YdgD
LALESFASKSWQADKRQGRRYSQAGYSHDRAHILTQHAGCTIQGFFPGEHAFAHQCDATFGDSGSPILAKRGAKYTVIGVHVAAAKGKSNSYGIAISGAEVAR